MSARPTLDLTVRPSTHDDVPAIARIYGHFVATGLASFELEPPSAAEMARRRGEVLERGFPYLVAEGGGTVLGYAYAGPYRLRPAYRYTAENSVYVRADAHGRGAGRALLAALLEGCRGRGIRQVVAVIGDSGNRASIALHEAAGFVRAGLLRSVGWKHDRWVDSVLMQRALEPGDGARPG